MRLIRRYLIKPLGGGGRTMARRYHSIISAR